MSYVIHRAGESPGLSSYAGDIWDAAGIRDRYQATYSRHEAEALSRVLNEYCVEGREFISSRVPELLSPTPPSYLRISALDFSLGVFLTVIVIFLWLR